MNLGIDLPPLEYMFLQSIHHCARLYTLSSWRMSVGTTSALRPRLSTAALVSVSASEAAPLTYGSGKMQGSAYTSCHVPEQVSRPCIFALGRFGLSLRYPLDDLLWCDWQFIDLDAEGLERILYRPCHRRWRHHTSSFATTLDAIRSER